MALNSDWIINHIYMLYLILFKPIKLYPLEKGYSFSNFIGHMYLDKKISWLVIFYRFPKDIKRFHYYLGNLFVRYLVFAVIISTVIWILINNSEFYKDIHNPFVIYGILIFGISIIMYQ